VWSHLRTRNPCWTRMRCNGCCHQHLHHGEMYQSVSGCCDNCNSNVRGTYCDRKRKNCVGVFCIRSVQLLNKLLHRPICKGCYEPYAARVHSTFILGILYQYYRRSGEGYTGGTSIIFFNSINLFLYKETVKGFYEEWSEFLNNF
jgi:hypothetical protein